MVKEKLKPQFMAEIVFDLAYLIFTLCSGVYMMINSNGSSLISLYGSLAIVLGLGDAFHLLPRAYSLLTNTMDKNVKALGFGKLVTSITMTLFYVMLYYIWQMLYQVYLPQWITSIVMCLAIMRIVLTVIPQNGWFQKETSYRYGIYRNIPFVLLGIIVSILFAISGSKGSGDGFGLMAPAILLSFLFYLVVVLFAGKHKKLGMFMLPKTCTYIWMICMGFYLI